MAIVFFVFMFVCLAYYLTSNKFHLGIMSFLMLIYMGSAASSLALRYFFEQSEYLDLSIEAVFYLAFALIILFTGFFDHKDYRLKYLLISNIRSVKFAEHAYLPPLIAAYFFFAFQASLILQGDIGAARVIIASGDLDHLSKFGVFNTIFSLAANSFMIPMIYGFLNLTTDYPGASRKKSTFHFFCSTIYIVYILSYVGRDGFVYWSMSFISLFLFFRDFIDHNQRKRIRNIFFFFSAPAFLLFIYISVARFGLENLVFTLFDYSGQQLFNFSRHYEVSPPLTYGAANFAPAVSLFNSILGSNISPFDRIEWFKYFLDQDVLPWVFTTLIGSFMHDFGKFGALLLTLAISLIAKYSLRDNRRGYIKFSDLILLLLLYQIVSWGVFYYRQYSAFSYILLMLCIYLFFKFSGSTKMAIIKKVR